MSTENESPTGGNYTLSFGGKTTEPIPYDELPEPVVDMFRASHDHAEDEPCADGCPRWWADPVGDLGRAAESFRHQTTPPVRTMVSQAVYEAARDNPDLRMQHLVESGQIVTWEMEYGEDEPE